VEGLDLVVCLPSRVAVIENIVAVLLVVVPAEERVWEEGVCVRVREVRRREGG
jgi:hypothetical protein